LTSESLKDARSESTGARELAVTLYPLFAEAQNNSYTSLLSININHLFTSLGKLLSNNQASGLPHAQGQSTWHSPPAAPSRIAVRNSMPALSAALARDDRGFLGSQQLPRTPEFITQPISTSNQGFPIRTCNGLLKTSLSFNPASSIALLKSGRGERKMLWSSWWIEIVRSD